MKFIYFFIVIDILLTSITYIYYRQNFAFAKTWSFFFVYLALAVNAVGSRLLPETAPFFILKASSWLSGLWIAFMYYSLMLALLHTLLWLGSKT